MLLTETEKDYFKTCVDEILNSNEFQQLDDFDQHCGVSRLDHSLSVAHYSYRFGIRLGLDLDYQSMVRGALLHDFFLYDWHDHTGRKGMWMHGFTHPREALNTSMEHFEINHKERDIILRHMWPLTAIPPRSREAMIVSLMDKYCAVQEMLLRRARAPREAVGV